MFFLLSYFFSKARLISFEIVNIRERSVVYLIILAVAVSSCDTLGIGDSGSGDSAPPGESLTIEKIDFRRDAVYTYEFLAWMEDTAGHHVEYLEDEVYQVRVVSKESRLPESDEPLILLKTDRPRITSEESHNAEFSYDWYYQTGNELARIATYNGVATNNVQPKKSPGSVTEWLRNIGAGMIQATPPISLQPDNQERSDTLYYDTPCTVVRYPVTADQEPYLVDTNIFTFKKIIEGQREVALADSVFNVFEIKNVLQDSLSNPTVYTDYIADIGLIKREFKSKLIHESYDPDQGPEVMRIRVELIDYQIKGEEGAVPIPTQGTGSY